MSRLSLALLCSVLGLYACSSDNKFEGKTTSASQAKAQSGNETPKPADGTPVEDNKIPEPDNHVAAEPVPSENATVENTKASEKEIEFGADEVFHIGDGAFAITTACAKELSTFNLTGVKYFFEFEVAEDDTDVNLTVGKVCGVDIKGDRFSLVDASSKEVKALNLPLDSSGDTKDVWTPFSTVNLAKGVYSVVVSSTKNSKGFGSFDFDDFLIGKINLKASKKVKALRIYTE